MRITHYETDGLKGRCNHKHPSTKSASMCLTAEYKERSTRNPIAFDDRYVIAVHADGSIVDVNPPSEAICDSCRATVTYRSADVAWRRNGLAPECSVPCSCGGKATWEP